MTFAGSDPLALGQKLVGVLDDGVRTPTYKLATLIALLTSPARTFRGTPTRLSTSILTTSLNVSSPSTGVPSATSTVTT